MHNLRFEEVLNHFTSDLKNTAYFNSDLKNKECRPPKAATTVSFKAAITVTLKPLPSLPLNRHHSRLEAITVAAPGVQIDELESMGTTLSPS
ncbi:hypothetical protein L1887_11510 [Cichorium endivia]|nr:hypothetical protein L1887_11510 [Cichorium endivia]